MTPSAAAKELLESLPFLKGRATVWPLTRDGELKLVIKLDHQYRYSLENIPKNFQGFSVTIESAVEVKPQLNFQPES